MREKLTDYIDNFVNTADYNDFIYEEFTIATDKISYLKAHRDYVEKNSLGFGDRAFHFMWHLLIKQLIQDLMPLSLLEIGVLKGQIISLWALIGKECKREDMEITGITPLEGNPKPKSKILNRLFSVVSKKFREDERNGNFYEPLDYYSIITSLYAHFSLDMGKTNIIKGYSTEDSVLEKARERKYSLIYIDGDHSYKGAINDIENFAPLLLSGGFLIMDDASCHVPGTKFWKGHQAVSDACERLPAFNLKNVLNVGHNRIFQKVPYEKQ